MKLYVWANPYPVPYGTSAFFAVADSVESAREIAKRAKSYSYVEYGGEDVKQDITVVLGEPTRIVDLPCGEWHQWSE